MDAKYQPTTQMRYLNAWEAFCDFCSRNGLRALPAEPETVVRYLGFYLARKTAQPATVANYLTAIGAVHKMAGLPSPIDDDLVHAAKLGYRRLYVTAEGALPERRGALPSAVIIDVVHLGLETTDRSLERECAGLVLSFLMCNRPGAAANLRVCDVRVAAGGLEVQVPTYKMGILKQSERISFRVPVAEGGWAKDPALRLVRRVWVRHLRAGRPLADHLFAPPGHSALQPLLSRVVTTWLRRVLTLTDHQPPLGVE